MMDLAVYACAGNAVLFVRASIEPPAEAVAAHGPLRFRGVISADPAVSPIWRQMAQQIDRHHFATVGLGEVALLLSTVIGVRDADDLA